MSSDVDFDETFISQGPARHFGFADALPVHTAHSWHMTPDAFVSSVPMNDHYGLPQHSYAEDHPTDGFLITASQGTSPELYQDDPASLPPSGQSTESWSEEESSPPIASLPRQLVAPVSSPTAPPDITSPPVDQTVPSGDEFLYQDPLLPLPPRRGSRIRRQRTIWNPSDMSNYVDQLMQEQDITELNIRVSCSDVGGVFPHRRRTHALST